MNMNEIKAAISAQTGTTVTKLQLVRQTKKNPETGVEEPTNWLSHWDNENRIRVSIPDNVMINWKNNKEFDGFALKRENKPAGPSKSDPTKIIAAQTQFYVIVPSNVEEEI